MKFWREERTGWRCQEISNRHGAWGFNCPCVDLDFVVVEYNHGLPAAIVEYKERHARPPVINHPTYRALCALADGYKDGPLPCLIATYCREDWWFIVTPLNEPAERHYSHCNGIPITEQRFVKSLYLLRKDVLDANDEAAIAQLNDIVPEFRKPKDAPATEQAGGSGSLFSNTPSSELTNRIALGVSRKAP